MNTIENLGPAPVARFIHRHTWALAVGIAMATMLLLAMGVRAQDGGVAPSQGVRLTDAAPSARSATERAWNEREDLKAASNVGLPGIY